MVQLEYPKINREIYGKNESNKVVEIYKFIQKQYKWGHLLIDDTHDTTPDIELRSNISVTQKNEYVRIPKLERSQNPFLKHMM